MSEKLVGIVSHFFGNISVAAIELSDGEIIVGDDIHFNGRTTDFTQKVGSIQIENHNVEKGKKGDSVGMKVKEKVRENDRVYKIVE